MSLYLCLQSLSLLIKKLSLCRQTHSLALALYRERERESLFRFGPFIHSFSFILIHLFAKTFVLSVRSVGRSSQSKALSLSLFSFICLPKPFIGGKNLPNTKSCTSQTKPNKSIAFACSNFPFPSASLTHSLANVNGQQLYRCLSKSCDITFSFIHSFLARSLSQSVYTFRPLTVCLLSKLVHFFPHLLFLLWMNEWMNERPLYRAPFGVEWSALLAKLSRQKRARALSVKEMTSFRAKPPLFAHSNKLSFPLCNAFQASLYLQQAKQSKVSKRNVFFASSLFRWRASEKAIPLIHSSSFIHSFIHSSATSFMRT